MKILTAPSNGGFVREGALALFVFSKESVSGGLLDEHFADMAARLMEEPSFRGKKGKISRLPLLNGGFSAAYLVGLGDRAKNGKESALHENIRSRSAELLRRCRADGVSKITVVLPDAPSFGTSCALAEGAELGAYAFSKYKSIPEEERLPEPAELLLLDGVDEGVSRGKMFACSQNWAKDIANEPGNIITPVSMADMAVQWGKDFGFEVSVWDEQRLLQEGMEGIYSVGMGSAHPPRLIHMVYRPSDSVRKVALVGKGVTFDSGGLNVKTGDSMRTMKGDKTGASNVFAILRGAAKMNIPCELHGIVPVAENMPGGKSFRPDDILRIRNGKTVEIENTDAEGRLLLADALCFACEQKPDAIIDMATLTGACAVALGQNMAGLFTPDDAFADGFLEVSARRGERFWRLPMDDDRIAEAMKSPVADLVNCGSRYGGAIFAAQFLKEFISDGIPWIHLDIAGVDMQKDEHSVYSKGATGFGVRSCLEYLLSISK